MKNRTIVLLMECDNISMNQCQMAMEYISEERRYKASQYVYNIDKILSVMGEFSLMYLLKKYYGIDYKNHTIKYQDRGKPYFVEKEMPSFNLSHTKNLVGIIVSDKKVGIDIENMKKEMYENIKLLMKVCFSEKECKYVSLGKEGDCQRFYEVWTSREAYYKMTGEGLKISNKKENIPSDINSFIMIYKQYCICICGVAKKDVEVIIVKEDNIDDMCKVIERR